MRKFLFFLISLIVLEQLTASEKHLLLIRDTDVTLGVKADLGGRVMLFRRRDGKNVLHSDPKHWTLSDKEIPARNYKSKFVEFNGHIVWIGPQSRWWKDTEPGLSKPRGFHPDPYLIYDRCKITEHTSKKLVLSGNPSPLNGMQMIKVFELIGDSKVRLTVKVYNRRKRTVTWNIWTNTRFNPDGDCGFLLNRKNSLIKFNAWLSYKNRALPFTSKDGICSFIRPAQDDIKKYNFHGKLGYKRYCPIYAVLGDNLFIKQVEGKYDIKATPIEHLPLEIYQRFSNSSKGDLMELEFHSPQFTLQPGQAKSFTEIWQLKKISSGMIKKSLAEIIKAYKRGVRNKKKLNIQ